MGRTTKSPAIADATSLEQIQDPSLYWSCCEHPAEGGPPVIRRSNAFPFSFLWAIAQSINSYNDHNQKKKEHLVEPIFWEVLCRSENVFIIQKNFTQQHCTTLRKNLDVNAKKHEFKVRNVNILCRNKLPANQLNSSGAYQIKNSTILFNKDRSHDFHDRVVLLDSGIWHFGSEVCCMHQAPHAFSGPWPDIGSSLRNFIRTSCNM